MSITYTEDYREILNRVLNIEGKPTNYKWDPGGETAFGISRVYWPQYWKDGPPTKERATEFYWVEFWLALKLPQIKYQPLRFEMFDAAVNCGIGNGVKFAVSAYNLLRPRDWPESILAMRPETIDGLNRMADKYPDALMAGCNYFQAKYYEGRSQSLRDEAIRGWFAKRLAWTPK